MNAKNDIPLTATETNGSANRGTRGTGNASRYFRPLGVLLLLSATASLFGQRHFCIGGNLDQLSPAGVAACEAKMADVRDAVKLHGSPDDWHFVVVCDEAGWKEAASLIANQPGLQENASYRTAPVMRATFLRSSTLSTDNPWRTAALLALALDNVPAQNTVAKPAVPGRPAPQYVAMASRRKRSPLAE